MPSSNPRVSHARRTGSGLAVRAQFTNPVGRTPRAPIASSSRRLAFSGVSEGANCPNDGRSSMVMAIVARRAGCGARAASDGGAAGEHAAPASTTAGSAKVSTSKVIFVERGRNFNCIIRGGAVAVCGFSGQTVEEERPESNDCSQQRRGKRCRYHIAAFRLPNGLDITLKRLPGQAHCEQRYQTRVAATSCLRDMTENSKISGPLSAFIAFVARPSTHLGTWVATCEAAT